MAWPEKAKCEQIQRIILDGTTLQINLTTGAWDLYTCHYGGYVPPPRGRSAELLKRVCPTSGREEYAVLFDGHLWAVLFKDPLSPNCWLLEHVRPSRE